ncbi:MAG: mycothiol synthase [Mycobacteriales bacterium]
MPDTAPPTPRRLTTVEADDVRSLLEHATRADGVEPLSEAGQLALEQADDAGHVLLRLGSELTGYAHRADRDAELVVHPDHRRHGIGSRLLTALEADSARPLVWAHGRLPAAVALAAARDYRQVRALLQMRSDSLDGLPDPVLPDGVRLRGFRPGADDATWLELNRRAFADHPEQSRWGAGDLQARMSRPWFDPAGFLLAERESDGALLGFHWTKVHPDGVGEVYVLGISPDAQGIGLGQALALAGLRHLRDRGVPAVLLYVEESNPVAVRLYDRLGFGRTRIDAQFARPDAGAPSAQPL